MKNVIALAVGIVFSVNIFSQAPEWAWAKSIGGIYSDEGSQIITDAVGNVYTTGHFTGTVDFDPGPGVFNLTCVGRASFISKLDASGNFVWARTLWSANGSAGGRVSFDASGNMYLSGDFSGTVDFDPGIGVSNLTATGSSDFFISKFTAAGTFIWVKSFGGTGSSIWSRTVQHVPGYIYFSGTFSGTVDFDLGAGSFNMTAITANDIFISKLDVAGNFIWAKSIAGANNNYGNSIAADAAGNVYVAGSFQDTVDFDPGPATFYLIPNGMREMFISKLDAAGNFLFAKAIGGTYPLGANSVTAFNSQYVYLLGEFQGTVDFDSGPGVYNLTASFSGDIFISKIDTSGNFIWAKSFSGPTSLDHSVSFAVDLNSNVYSTGFFTGTVDFDPGNGVFNLTPSGMHDIFVSKLDGSGNFVWAKSVGGANAEGGFGISVDASSNVYITGSFESPFITFGSTTLTRVGPDTLDIFIAKLNGVVGIEDIDMNHETFLFPNPATNEIRVESTTFKVQSAEIYDVLGKKISLPVVSSQLSVATPPLSTDHYQLTLDVSKLSPGIYFLKVKGEKGEHAAKFVKQ